MKRREKNEKKKKELKRNKNILWYHCTALKSVHEWPAGKFKTACTSFSHFLRLLLLLLIIPVERNARYLDCIVLR